MASITLDESDRQLRTSDLVEPGAYGRVKDPSGRCTALNERGERRDRVHAETFEFTSVQPSRAFEGIVNQIKERIIDGRLAHGSRLPPEREMAETFGVSRASLREALRVLEALGVLSGKRGVGPQSGYVIAPGEGDHFGAVLELHAALLGIPLLDLLEVREALESVAIAGACARVSERDCAELSGIIDLMYESLEPETFLDSDTQFHVAIARLSGNVVAPLLMQALRGAISRQMLDTFRTLEDWPTERSALIAEHRQILDVIVSRDPSKATDAIHRHLHGFYFRASLSDQSGRRGTQHPKG